MNLNAVLFHRLRQQLPAKSLIYGMVINLTRINNLLVLNHADKIRIKDSNEK